MPGLHVANASALQPAVESLGASEGQLEQMFERCGLPPAMVPLPTGIVTLYCAERFLELAHWSAGEDTFCFQSFDKEEMRPASVVANAPLPVGLTGLDAARQFARSLDGVITGARFYCSVDSKHAWILRSTSATTYSDNWSVLQYNLRAIVSGMKRLYAGRIAPVSLKLPAGYKTGRLPEELCHLQRMDGVAEFGIGYSIADVTMATTIPKQVRQGEMLHRPLATTSARHVAACLLMLLETGDTSRLANRAARTFGVSLRTYQRRLRKMGTTHAEILEQARLTLALQRLADPFVGVTEIAGELGYLYPGHFTRFFKRNMGLSPVRYRQLLSGG